MSEDIKIVNAVDFKTWQEDGMTKVVYQFLEDVIETQTSYLLERMGTSNQDNLSSLAELSGSIKAFDGILNLDAKEINDFYSKTEEDE